MFSKVVVSGAGTALTAIPGNRDGKSRSVEALVRIAADRPRLQAVSAAYVTVPPTV
jgi:hypothetical protein